ncbi:MAG: hypothetical protein HEP71_33855 [Roseivirga sp.]|nr:hypothetical protein [Roseivirga sp.]
MSRTFLYLGIVLTMAVSACGAAGEGKTVEEQPKAAAARDTTQTPAPAPKPEPESIPEPEPEPEVIPSRDPDFTGVFSDSLESYRVEFLPDTAGLQYIRENVLVRVGISDSQIDKLKSNSPDPDNFYIPADDNLFYMAQLSEKAEAMGLKVVNADERYLGFLGINSSVKELYDLEKDSLRGVYWTFIAFNTTRGARQINSIVDADMEKVAHYINKDVYPTILLEDTALWNLPTRLAAQDSIADTHFWQFLKDYREAALALGGENLWYHPEYKYYDDRINRYDEPEHPLGIILRREVRKLGYEFTSYQGDAYFSQSPAFVRRYLYPIVSDTMGEFLDIFLLSYTLGYWDEGSLMVEPVEIARHIVLWEQFAQKHPDFIAPDYATNEASDLVSYILDDGMDYNPYFSEEDSTLQARFISGYKYLIEKAPETTSGRKIGEYYRLLEANQFKKTDTVANYLKAYWDERRALQDQ